MGYILNKDYQNRIKPSENSTNYKKLKKYLKKKSKLKINSGFAKVFK